MPVLAPDVFVWSKDRLFGNIRAAFSGTCSRTTTRIMIYQRTLRNVIRATGIGLHTGEKVYLTLRPAPVDTGVVFVRIDLDEAIEIPALTEYVGVNTITS